MTTGHPLAGRELVLTLLIFIWGAMQEIAIRLGGPR